MGQAGSAIKNIEFQMHNASRKYDLLNKFCEIVQWSADSVGCTWLLLARELLECRMCLIMGFAWCCYHVIRWERNT